MLFWPEKAHEWVALVGGSIGAISGLTALTVSILNYRRDRAKVRLRFNRNRYGVTLRGYDPNRTYYILKVINEGRRPVQIERVDALLYPGGGFLIVTGSGSVLTEQNPETVVPIDAEHLNLDEIWYFSVLEGTGREHRLYLDGLRVRWWKALKTRKARRALRDEVRAKPEKGFVIKGSRSG